MKFIITVETESSFGDKGESEHLICDCENSHEAEVKSKKFMNEVYSSVCYFFEPLECWIEERMECKQKL